MLLAELVLCQLLIINEFIFRFSLYVSYWVIYTVRWRGGLVVSALDQRPRGRWLRSNRGPVAVCTLGLGLLNHPSSRGR